MVSVAVSKTVDGGSSPSTPANRYKKIDGYPEYRYQVSRVSVNILRLWDVDRNFQISGVSKQI